MIDLNDGSAVRAADPYHLLDYIVNLPQQLEDGWTAAEAIELPGSFRQVDRVVMAGMGGSAISGSLFASLMEPESHLPVSVVRNYDLPAYASGANTLVIASSNSGSTEETLSMFAQARSRGCQVLAVATGGKLMELARDVGAPFIQINSTAQARAALGWSLSPLLNVASRLNWVHNLKDDLAEAVGVMRGWTRELDADSPITMNLAKREAGQLMGRSVYMFGAGYFAAVARRWKDQISETAKSWGALEELPEADHNSVAGVDWPDGFSTKVMALFLTGQADHPRNRQRVELTRKAYLMAGCNTDIMTARGESPLAQMLSLVQLGDFMSFYLALSYGVEPARVPIIAEFKAELAAG